MPLSKSLNSVTALRLLLILGGCYMVIAPCVSQARRQAACQILGENRTVCRISEPNVRQKLTQYSDISFKPGDRIRVNAGGCVQTGGSGKTWKRYVNPAGPKSDQFYHGLIEIPGATGGLVRVETVLGKELVVPSSGNASALTLRLGYEDNDYSDNGYWGRDNGTGDQCKGEENAFVEITVQSNPSGGAPEPIKPLSCAPGSSPQDSADADHDGVLDTCEEFLAREYAPVVIHAANDPNLPANVDWFLSKTSLYFYDDNCTPDLHQRLKEAPRQADLLNISHSGDCGSGDIVSSSGTRSLRKQRTFYLEDVADEFRKGSLDSRDWTTYFHAYLNDRGGVTVQFWRFYTYNSGLDEGGIEFGFHGGDWEGIHVVLDKSLRPEEVALLGHRDIDTVHGPDWSGMRWDGTHPVIYSDRGSHSSGVRGTEGIRQETWSGGKVVWPGGKESQAGTLTNVGEKVSPLNNQLFIQYSGIWGSPGTFYFSSGYWGPAFNETKMGNDGFITAWCSGMRSPTRSECYPVSTSR